MRLEIRAADSEDGAALRDFYRWLRQDDDGPEQVGLAPDAAGPTGAMGAMEVVEVVLTQSFALATLTMQYAGWRRSTAARPPTAGFTFTRASDGLSVTVAGGSDDEVRRVMALLADAPPPPDSGGPNPL
ncbi:hypothetical protein V2S66_17920 [Streptomyces sp. V4-01]|uniref:Uncharacterized protein n=1 Tax=Actinacidiphila polyblastidii TaxID=3110430 RepID=A0ABU7PDH8_9ACTN|nr:hypothetical protein [Streptomyces sp. V4-01]